MNALLDNARALAPQLVAWRRALHQHPELGHEEEWTSAFIRERLRELGIPFEHPIGATGIVAQLGQQAGRPTLGLRADFDALPIEEDNDLPFRSTIPGRGHLCGHDAHTAILLGAAALLKQHEADLPCNVRFFFQHAEEVIPSGASDFVRAGALDGVTRLFALHNAPSLPAGTYGVSDGPVMAACVKFGIRFTGRGGHAAFPENAVSPLPAVADLISSTRTLARDSAAGTPAVFSLCSLRAGDAFNVIPEIATVGGTARAFDEAVLTGMEQRLANLLQAIGQRHGLSAHLEWHLGTPPVVNDPRAARQVRETLAALGVAPSAITHPAPVMGAEDFAWMGRVVPSCYFFLGTGDPGLAVTEPWHSPRFRMNEDVMPVASAVFARLAWHFGD